MPAVRTIRHTYSARPERLFALLCDPGYLQQRCEADGDRNIRVERTDAGRRVSVERDHTIELPSFVRGLVKPTNRATEVCTWQRIDGGFQAAYVVSARGMPGTLGGTLRIEGDELVTQFEATFEVVARVPLIANKLEALMADGFATYLERCAEHADAALRGSFVRAPHSDVTLERELLTANH